MKDSSQITLRDALKAFSEENAASLSQRNLSPEAMAFFQNHDIAHVVFGCDTSVFGEGIVKLFTIWGTSLGFRGHIAGYSEVGALSLFRQYSVRHLARHFGKLLLAAPGAIIHARRMNRPWPWSDYDQYLDLPLTDVRREFNIRVLGEKTPASPA